MPLTRIKTTVIDHVFLSEFLGTVASESAMLALVGGIGDYAVRSDLNNDSFIITQNDGSSIDDWQKISNSSTALLKSENLSDLNDAATARSSLGLGTAATNDTGDFLQPANNLSDLNNAGTALDNLGFSSFGKNIIDDVDAAAVRTTLGLGEVATLDVAGGAQDFVATGAISAGQIVGLRSDGTVEVVVDDTTTQTEDVGTPAVFESASSYFISATFDSSNNKVVIAYRDAGNLDYGTAVVGTVSGTSISFGTPVVFESSVSNIISATFDSSQNKVVITYQDTDESTSDYGTAVVGTVSGTSISFGTPVVFEYSATTYISATFDSSNNKVVIAYRDDGNSGYGTAVVGTVSGTSISFGTPVVFESATTSYISATFDSSQNKVVIAYTDTVNSSFGTAVVGTVSGTSISFGTPVVFESAITSYISATFDSSQNKVVIAYRDNGNSNYGTAVVGTVSGTSISFGTPIVFNEASTGFPFNTFDSNSNKVVIIYRESDNSSFGTAVVGTVSGTSISFGTPIVFNEASTSYNSATFDSSQNKVVITYSDIGNSSYGTAVVYTPPSLSITTNADSWLGIASQNISDGGTGTVTILSGVNENQTGLTPNSIYYVNYDGTLTVTENSGPVNGTYGKIGRALSSTKLLITEGNA